jgi:hypothetical protein
MQQKKFTNNDLVINKKNTRREKLIDVIEKMMTCENITDSITHNDIVIQEAITNKKN